MFQIDESSQHGEVFTRRWVVELILDLAGFTADRDLATVTAVEPSCGESGRLAKAIDAWAAHELRRAGFGADEVWPRLHRPRVLPREVALFIEGLPKRQQEEARRQLEKNKRVAPSEARILGRAYVKQVEPTPFCTR